MPDIQNQKERHVPEVLEQVNLVIEWTTSPISYRWQRQSWPLQSLSEQTFYYSQMNLQET
jgi:hypothetical protein